MLQDSFKTAEQDIKTRALVEARVMQTACGLATQSALQADGDLLSKEERSHIESLMVSTLEAKKLEDAASSRGGNRSLSQRHRSLCCATHEPRHTKRLVRPTHRDNLMPVIQILPHAELCPQGSNSTCLLAPRFREALLDNHINIEHACDMSCACTTCHVIVREGFNSLNPLDETEEDLLDRAWGLEPNSRLSCQAIVAQQSLVIEIPKYTINHAKRKSLSHASNFLRHRNHWFVARKRRSHSRDWLR
jgi:2Fe-2S ferredoxin